MKIRFVPRDCWIGLYWKPEIFVMPFEVVKRITWYVCIIPCFPIIFETEHNITRSYYR